MDEHKKPTIGFWTTVAGVLFTPLASYVGAYLTLVVAVEYRTFGSTGGLFGLVPVTVAVYRWPEGDELESKLWQDVFRPLNYLDRKVRHEKWERGDETPTVIDRESTSETMP